MTCPSWHLVTCGVARWKRARASASTRPETHDARRHAPRRASSDAEGLSRFETSPAARVQGRPVGGGDGGDGDGWCSCSKTHGAVHAKVHSLCVVQQPWAWYGTFTQKKEDCTQRTATIRGWAALAAARRPKKDVVVPENLRSRLHGSTHWLGCHESDAAEVKNGAAWRNCYRKFSGWFRSFLGVTETRAGQSRRQRRIRCTLAGSQGAKARRTITLLNRGQGPRREHRSEPLFALSARMITALPLTAKCMERAARMMNLRPPENSGCVGFLG